MFSFMTKSAIEKGKTALIFTHRTELLKQAGGAFKEFGLTPNYIRSGKTQDTNKKLHVAMVETFARRIEELTEFLNTRDLIIFDEAHLQNFNKILDRITNPNVVVIGATATPFRKGKNERCLSENYDEIIQVVDTPELIEKGRLCPAISYGVPIDLKGLKRKGNDYDTSHYYDENKIYKGVVKNWEKHANGEKTILFASNVANSIQVAKEFYNRRHLVKHIDGSMSARKRAQIFEWFDKTKGSILCNCGIATTGFDQKDIKCVILYRATTSLPLFLQMCGRGSRTYPNKNNFKILDFGNNIQRHGFWEQPRTWEIEKKKTRQKEDAAPLKECPECYSLNYMSAKVCNNCGHEFKTKEQEEKEVVLQILEKNNLTGRKLSELYTDELIILQKSKVLKSSLVWRIVRSKGANIVKLYAEKMGYSRGWIFRQLKELDNVKYTDRIL